MSAGYAPELEFAAALAREAGALLKSRFGEAQEIDFKGRINPVTRMDHESERLIVGRIADRFRGDDVLAEEGHGGASGSDRVWIVDPLDGTVNYAHEYPVWSVSIALQVAGRLEVGVVYNPLLDELYAGRRGGGVTLNGVSRRVTACDSMERALLATGFSYDLSGDGERNNLGPFGRFILKAQAVRRAGSAALAISKVAVGRTDGFWERNLQPWDMAAAALLVEEGGGRLSDYAGGDGWMAAKQLVASNGSLHEEMLSVVRPPAHGGGRGVPRSVRVKRGEARCREMREEDATRVAELAGELGYPSTAEQILARKAVLDRQGMSVVYVAEAADRSVVGWIIVSEICSMELDPHAEVKGLVVADGARSGGVGAKLMEVGESWAKARGLTEMVLRSNVIRERAHAFYGKLGYEEQKRQVKLRRRLA